LHGKGDGFARKSSKQTTLLQQAVYGERQAACCTMDKVAPNCLLTFDTTAPRLKNERGSSDAHWFLIDPQPSKQKVLLLPNDNGGFFRNLLDW
jgi:hypothetical protein